MGVIITDIQHFSLHDGQGIRTTVFLKGCSLKCPWCANPECISSEIDRNFGKKISLDNLESEILKDKSYYKTGGGVTFSGGEPLLQIEDLEPLLISLNKKNIDICFETALFVPEKLLKIAIKYANNFIVDIKILDSKKCKNILGGNINQYLNNLNLLNINKTTFRIPLSECVLDKDNINLILELLTNFKSQNVEIFKIHDLAKRKYDLLNQNQYFKEVSDEDVNNLYFKLNSICNCNIIEI